MRAWLSFLLLLAPMGALAQDTIPRSRPTRPMERRPIQLANVKLASLDEDVEVFVRLDRPSVAEFCRSEIAAGRGYPARAMQMQKREEVGAQQAAIRSQLEAVGAHVLSRLRVGANGFRIKVRRRQLEAIRHLSGVVSVAPVTRYRLSNETSVPWIGAPDVWSEFGTGENVRIAIIDSGIDYTHANFGGPGTISDYTSNDPAVIEPGTFPTAKVIGGTDLAGTSYDANGDVGSEDPTPDPDPLDVDGHGSHVAGTAAGLGVDGKIGPGVAKGASLYAIKVFGDVAGSTSLVSDAIEWALDPNGDGSTDDHVDVINMSLGSPFGSPDDPSAIASDNATALGVVVVAAAGNEGDVPYVTGSPAVAPGVISVAASVDGGYGEVALLVNDSSAMGQYPSLEGTVGTSLAIVGPVTAEVGVADPLDACAALTNDLTGKIALVERGTCSFVAKHQNALDAGAIGVIIYNHATGGDDLVLMGGGSVPIPGTFIGHTSGETIRSAALAETVNATMQIYTEIPRPELADTLASFSSRGPGHGGSAFKPDVSAPGLGIRSTGVGTGDGPAILGGTSMASPHVAGVAALLRAIHPDLAPADIKALIQNSAVTANDGDAPYPLARQGTGVVRADLAAHLDTIAEPGGVSFGRVNPTTNTRVQRDVTLRNLGDSTEVFRVQHVANQTFPGVIVSGPRSVSVPAHGTATATLTFRMNPALGPFDDGFFSQTEVDGWFLFKNKNESVRVGYVAAVDPASRQDAATAQKREVRIRNRGPSLGWVEGFTLADKPQSGPGPSPSLGFRSNELFGFSVMELGLATELPWESMSNVEADIYIDVDQDGVPDVLLVAVDFSAFGGDFGTMVTAQIDLASGNGFVDWNVVADYNDQTAILPFTRSASGGFVPDRFDYLMLVFRRDGSTTQELGSINLRNEIVPILNDFGLPGGGAVTLTTTGGRGKMLWLFPNNTVGDQSFVVRVR